MRGVCFGGSKHKEKLRVSGAKSGGKRLAAAPTTADLSAAAPARTVAAAATAVAAPADPGGPAAVAAATAAAELVMLLPG